MKGQQKRGHTPPGAPVDREFLADLRARDSVALERFFDLFYDRIFSHVARLLGDPHVAEDVTHEIFLRLHGRIHQLDPDRDPTSWVFTVATNAVRDHWRSRRHRESRRQVPLAAEHLDTVASPAESPWQELERSDDARQIRQALAEMTDADREIILLRDYEAMDTAAIATILGAKPDAVRQRHSRALARLGAIFRRIIDEMDRTP